ALQAIKLVFKYLKRAYDNGNDREAREKMHNASCIAGMAFTNAFLGINHSLAHKLGSAFHIPHGRANAIILPYVIEYNAQKPTKFATFPKYEKFTADVRYAEIAEMLGLPCSTTEEGVKSLVKAIRDLERSVNEVKSVQDCGIDETVYLNALDELADEAHEDQCTPANPRYPLISELKELYIKSYYGEEN
ncbi:MAG: iron-containing alcohol dehydrogenase, partial [Oscillospiraceae bacterium]